MREKKKRNHMNYVEHLENLCELARGLNRGCDCENDYRCSSCETVVRIKHAIAVFDVRGQPLTDTCDIPGCISHSKYMEN